jgi:hypothetical protein
MNFKNKLSHFFQKIRERELNSNSRLSFTLKKIQFFLFNILLIFTPFLFTWFNEELFEFNKMLFVYLIAILVGGCWMARMILEERLIFRTTVLDWPLLVFVSSQVLATLFSIHPPTSIFGYYTRFHGGLLSTFSYAVLYWALVSNFNFNQVKTFLRSALLAGIAVSLYAIPEKVGISPSCIIIRGQANVECWVQDVKHRVFATFGQPNWLAAYLIMLIPLGISFYLNILNIKTDKTRLKQKQITQTKATTIASWWLLALSVMWIALLFTNSRAGLAGIGAGLVVLVLLKLRLLKLNNQPLFGKSNKQFFIPLLIFISTTIIIGTDFTPTLKDLYLKFASSSAPTQEASPTPAARGTTNPNINITPSEKIRMIVWRGAVKIWQRYPVFGSGPETFAYSYYLDRPMMHNLVSEWDFLYNKAHNEWLNYLATSGLVGLLSYLWLIGTSLWIGLKLSLKTNPVKNQDFVLGLLAGLVALHISNFLGFSTVMVSVLWVVFAAGLSLIYIQHKPDMSIRSQQDKTQNKQLTHRPGVFKIFTLIMLVLIQLHLIAGVVKIWWADYLYTQAKNHLSIDEYEAGVTKLQQAIQLRPNQALFYDELANAYAEIAAQFSQLKETETAQEYAQLAIEAADTTLRLNPHQLNFYKTRSSVFTQLATLDPAYLQEAHDALLAAQALAPTDPKLVYHQGLIVLAQGQTEKTIKLIRQAIEMKPNYHQARYKLAQIYEQQENYAAALEQYRFILDYLIPNDRNLQQKVQELGGKLETMQTK